MTRECGVGECVALRLADDAWQISGWWEDRLHRNEVGFYKAEIVKYNDNIAEMKFICKSKW